jgi:hypothetical protein
MISLDSALNFVTMFVARPEIKKKPPSELSHYCHPERAKPSRSFSEGWIQDQVF